MFASITYSANSSNRRFLEQIEFDGEQGPKKNASPKRSIPIQNILIVFNNDYIDYLNEFVFLYKLSFCKMIYSYNKLSSDPESKKLSALNSLI